MRSRLEEDALVPVRILGDTYSKGVRVVELVEESGPATFWQAYVVPVVSKDGPDAMAFCIRLCGRTDVLPLNYGAWVFIVLGF